MADPATLTIIITAVIGCLGTLGGGVLAAACGALCPVAALIGLGGTGITACCGLIGAVVTCGGGAFATIISACCPIGTIVSCGGGIITGCFGETFGNLFTESLSTGVSTSGDLCGIMLQTGQSLGPCST